LQPLVFEILLSDLYQRQAELIKRPGHAGRVFPGRLDPQIDILGLAWLGVVNHRIRTDDEILNVVFGKHA
jgi:hypothetical protein